jgi:hypothetical protein
MNYPFIPKSTRHLIEGQFWAIPLISGRFACGRVLQLDTISGKRDNRIFLAGLMDWSGDTPPSSSAIAGRCILEHGGAHIKTIRENGLEILGCRSLVDDGVIIPQTLSDGFGPKPRIQRGFETLGYASPEQRRTLRVFATWGYRVINLLAEEHFGNL